MVYEYLGKRSAREKTMRGEKKRTMIGEERRTGNERQERRRGEEANDSKSQTALACLLDYSASCCQLLPAVNPPLRLSLFLPSYHFRLCYAPVGVNYFSHSKPQ